MSVTDPYTPTPHCQANMFRVLGNCGGGHVESIEEPWVCEVVVRLVRVLVEPGGDAVLADVHRVLNRVLDQQAAHTPPTHVSVLTQAEELLCARCAKENVVGWDGDGADQAQTFRQSMPPSSE